MDLIVSDKMEQVLKNVRKRETNVTLENNITNMPLNGIVR